MCKDKDTWVKCEYLDGTWYYMNLITYEKLPPGVTPIYKGGKNKDERDD